MMEKVIDDPNTPSSQLLDNLKHISNQGTSYSKYDNEVYSLRDDNELVESFFTANHYMFNKFLVIVIILVLSLFILNNFK